MIGIHYDSYSNEVHTWVHFDTCPAEISIWSLGSVLPSSGLCCSLRCDQTVRWGRWWLWCRSWNIFSRKWSQWFDGVWRYFGMPKFESGLKGLFFSIGGLWLNCFDSKKTCFSNSVPVPSLVDQEKLGTFFLEPPPLDLSLCYEDSSPCIPCLGFLFWFLNWHWNHWNLNMNEIWNDIFISDSDLSRLIYILASGSDPMADIQKLAETSLAYNKPVPGSHYQRTVDLLICRSEVSTVCRICEYFVILHNSYSHRWPSLQTLNMQLSKAWYACQDQSHQLGSGARSKGGNPYLINMPLVISSHLSRPLLVLMKDPNPANGSFRRGCLISLRGISGWRRLKKWRRFREECSMTVIFCDSLRREVAEMLSVRRHGILKILLALHQSQRRYCSFCHNQQIDQWRFLSENGRSCCRIVTWRRASCQHWNQSFATKVISTAQCLVVAEYQSSQWQRVFLRWKSLTQKAWTRSLPFDQGEWSTIVFFFKMLFSLAMLDFKKYTMKQDACLHLFTPD